MSKTRIVTTQRNGAGKKRSKTNQLRRMTKKTHRTHKGYSMKNIIKGQMTFKRRGRKR